MTFHYETLTAEEILKIKSPYMLFGSKFHAAASRKLRQMWHPDRNDDPLAVKYSAISMSWSIEPTRVIGAMYSLFLI
jgi:hypothetical protein